LILVLDSTECLSAAVPLATFEKSGSTHLHVSRADLVASTALLANYAVASTASEAAFFTAFAPSFTALIPAFPISFNPSPTLLAPPETVGAVVLYDKI